MRIFSTLIFVLLTAYIFAQTNMVVSNNEADNILKGNYDPQLYSVGATFTTPSEIISVLAEDASSDSLEVLLTKLVSFHNRNTGSDTLSADTGIGAARSWIYSKLQSYSARHNNRLIVSYLKFDENICGMNSHKNVLGVLPGVDTNNHQIVVLEAHMDSRCDNGCDVACVAHGADDNGSGTVLVMELARLLSQYAFNHTFVFMLTTGEEQGLYGGRALADYASDNSLPIKAVQNNDVIGGIICGETASPPTACNDEGQIDSTSIRLFSFYSSFYNQHRNFAKFIKLEYEEELASLIDVPMEINIMNQEDRTGRGGDHIPFRENGFTSLRFTSEHEHGHGAPGVGYTDHQHTSNDVIGYDTDNDMELDSMFVDFNYLRRNALINGVSAIILASGPKAPDFELQNKSTGIEIEAISSEVNSGYKVIVSSNTTDYDAVYNFYNTTEFIVPNTKKDSTYYITIAAIDANGCESLFADEERVTAAGDGPVVTSIKDLLKNDKHTFIDLIYPNPTNKQISIKVVSNTRFKKTWLTITNIAGEEIERIPIYNDSFESIYQYSFDEQNSGVYFCNLHIDNKIVSTRKVLLY